ncbi:MAG: RNA polymerase sigma-70 factor, partial [Odoribacter sp.]|nr:RNA polymerase sigma-70 factor [Odoribacter sp.]
MNKETWYERIRGGDVVAFEAVFREFYPSMCVVAGKYLADKEVAEDIAQEVFVRLWEKREVYQSIPDLRTFLYVSVRNLCFNYLR